MTNKSELLKLKNVGPAMLKDLHILGIYTVDALKKQDPSAMYKKLQEKTNTKHDICVLDVFTAIVEEANTGKKLDWWYFSRLRKKMGIQPK